MTKESGGPGSGVSSPNTKKIIGLKQSNLVSLHTRAKIKESADPDPVKDVELTDIKWQAQDKFVPAKVVRIVSSKDTSWMQKPIDLLWDFEHKNYHLMDGHHRFLAAKMKGLKTLPANVWKVHVDKLAFGEDYIGIPSAAASAVPTIAARVWAKVRGFPLGNVKNEEQSKGWQRASGAADALALTLGGMYTGGLALNNAYQKSPIRIGNEPMLLTEAVSGSNVARQNILGSNYEHIKHIDDDILKGVKDTARIQRGIREAVGMFGRYVVPTAAGLAIGLKIQAAIKSKRERDAMNPEKTANEQGILPGMDTLWPWGAVGVGGSMAYVGGKGIMGDLARRSSFEKATEAGEFVDYAKANKLKLPNPAVKNKGFFARLSTHAPDVSPSTADDMTKLVGSEGKKLRNSLGRNKLTLAVGGLAALAGGNELWKRHKNNQARRAYERAVRASQQG